MNTLRGGGSLHPGQQLRSNNGRYTLVMQHDGNLVLYEPGGKAAWDTGTWGGSTGDSSHPRGDAA
jgi:hypothetical protein